MSTLQYGIDALLTTLNYVVNIPEHLTRTSADYRDHSGNCRHWSTCNFGNTLSVERYIFL